MKPLKKVALVAITLLCIFAFSKSKKTTPNLNLANLNAVEILEKQSLECRPTGDFMFYVETELVKKSRGFNTVNANVYLMDRVTGQYNLLATENIAIPNHKDMIALDYEFIQGTCDQTSLVNGDRIVGNSANAPYCFSELITNEIVYNSYISSTNKLLGLDRSI